MTGVEIVEQFPGDLVAYASVPISFQVREVLDVEQIHDGLGGFAFAERKLDVPYVKDYDAIDGEAPTFWAKRWDISKWGILAAFANGSLVGGCAIAYDTPGLDMLEGRTDIAVLWDIRVRPDHRRDGIGRLLFEAAVEWAKARPCRLLKVETQNVNVPACKFYARQGSVLGTINRFAYDEFPNEVQLIWYREL